MGGLGIDLQLRQRRRAAGFDWSGGVLGGDASLARSGTATRVNAAGLVAAEAGARFDHDPATLARRGLLLEGAATNLLIWSEALEQAAWAKTGAAVTAEAGVAPDGSNGAERLVETAVTSQHRATQTLSVVAGQTYAASAFVKAGERTKCMLRVSGTGAVANATFDLVAETAGAGAGAATMQRFPNGWWRVSVAGVADAASISWSVVLCDPGGALSYAGDGASGMLVWGAMLETGPVATSYVPSGAAPGARGADQLQMNWGARGVPDGAATVRVGFDDASGQDVAAAVSGGAATLAGPLARAWVVRAGVV